MWFPLGGNLCLQVVNENYEQIDNLTPIQFSKLYWNRTYIFPFRSFSLGSDGLRINDVVFNRMDLQTGSIEVPHFRFLLTNHRNSARKSFQEAWRYYITQSKLVEKSNSSRIWRSPNGPPANRPACGFQNDLCSTDYSKEQFKHKSRVSVCMICNRKELSGALI